MVHVWCFPQTETLEGVAALLRERVECLPPDERVQYAARLASSLLEVAGYEAARTSEADLVTTLMSLAARADELADRFSSP